MQIPKNVVQTGAVDACHKMYIEDYVHIFLKQYKDEAADFCLYGKIEKEGELNYYFVYGAAREEPDREIVESRYFSGMNRIGEATSDGNEIWLFMENGYAAPMEGYFIFYEQNEDMQSYLIAVHQNQPGEKEITVRPRAAADSAASGHIESRDTSPEPRRIKRRQYKYGVNDCEKAKERPLAASNFPVSGGFALGRAIPVALLLIICAMGVSSINQYPEMQEAGTLFSKAVDSLIGEDKAKRAEVEEIKSDKSQINTSQSETSGENDGFQVQENQNTTYVELIAEQPVPVFSASVEQPETAAEEPTESDSLTDEVPQNSVESPAETSQITDDMDLQETVPAQTDASTTYTVRKGDNLAAICRSHYGNTDRIQEVIALNDLPDPNHLYPGQKIILPH